MSDFRGKRAELNVYDDAVSTDIINKLNEFIEFLKKHSFLCDPGNWYSFDAIDTNDLDDFLKDFLEEQNND